MQFHLNGFRPGDPSILEQIEPDGKSSEMSELPSEVDVLIVGCGPAGLTLAAQLAAFPNINTRIVDQKSGPLQMGQADGIACRTMEMFNAFGFVDRVTKEAYWVNETTFWKPADGQRENIVRGGRIQDTEDGLSEFPHVILNQARVHDFYLEVMRNSRRRLRPDYSRRLLDLQIDRLSSDNAASHPITVRLERTDDDHAGQVETVKARYVVGCDGARSTVRRSLGLTLEGDSANQAWGVMDVLATSNFPDIRLKAAIHSASEGSILIIPREGGYMVRFYIELDKLREDERIANRNITADQLVAAAQRILRPYTLLVKEIVWWSVYEIGQRLCDRFDDVTPKLLGKPAPRVFIVGDACHTHSPKAGQGMNVSMQDAFNLGWKLAAVLEGRSPPGLLHTYSAERQAIAKELIDFDREFARMFSARPKESQEEAVDSVDPAEFQNYFVKQGRFTAGTATRYARSAISGAGTYQHLAKGLTIGMRFHSAPVVRLADAKPLHLGHAFKADGRWRLIAFLGAEDPSYPNSGIRKLCSFLTESAESPLLRHTRTGADIDAVLDLRAVFQQDHRLLDVGTLPPLLLPQKGSYGLHDYEKAFCVDQRTGMNIFEMRGIDRDDGCIVLLRPDQYVAHILPIDSHGELAAFFDGFMLRQN
ncbi:FAD-binding monooxygenase [Phyllobacterium sophorae]|uniref:Phenol 2-monooxygenase n=1 Tax=Phyllobacterium sophorae TaxID=1520277 RepID=A0A2P7BFM0_9HYPH|nr:FAD-binding monooxygenase [Phyllobacterium sophorae]PSH65235.1 phenol 2-monooxygenase [Phyllobacterium sophorae]